MISVSCNKFHLIIFTFLISHHFQNICIIATNSFHIKISQSISAKYFIPHTKVYSSILDLIFFSQFLI